MKKLYTAIAAVMALDITGTAVLLLFMPDTIPAHYNLAGEVDRFGSKYESLVFPAFVCLTGVLFLLLARWQGKKNETGNQKVLLYTALCSTLFFAAEGFYFMIKDIRYDPAAAPAVDLGIWRLAGAAVGLVLVAVGNILPKARRNALFGLRTRWSMANDAVWQRSQRFGGFASVVCGLVLAAASLLIPEAWCLPVMAVIVILWLAACVAASYRFYRESGGDARPE